MRRGLDYHIHTYYQRCGNQTLTVDNIIRRAEQRGLKSIAITDHLNRRAQLPAFRQIKADIAAAQSSVEVFFGVELNYDGCDGDFVYDPETHEQYGFEVVIGGIHSAYTDSRDMDEVFAIQHRHFMRTLENPLLDVLVHPFWFPRNQVEQRSSEWWEEFIYRISDDYIEQWAQASLHNRCAIELNAAAIFYNGAMSEGFKANYVEMVRRLRDAGALFSTGSDAHDIDTLGITDYVDGLLDGLRVPEEQIFRPRR